jgi:hypothetical protein
MGVPGGAAKQQAGVPSWQDKRGLTDKVNRVGEQRWRALLEEDAEKLEQQKQLLKEEAAQAKEANARQSWRARGMVAGGEGIQEEESGEEDEEGEGGFESAWCKGDDGRGDEASQSEAEDDEDDDNDDNESDSEKEDEGSVQQRSVRSARWKGKNKAAVRRELAINAGLW